MSHSSGYSRHNFRRPLPTLIPPSLFAEFLASEGETRRTLYQHECEEFLNKVLDSQSFTDLLADWIAQNVPDASAVDDSEPLIDGEQTAEAEMSNHDLIDESNICQNASSSANSSIDENIWGNAEENYAACDNDAEDSSCNHCYECLAQVYQNKNKADANDDSDSVQFITDDGANEVERQDEQGNQQKFEENDNSIDKATRLIVAFNSGNIFI